MVIIVMKVALGQVVCLPNRRTFLTGLVPQIVHFIDTFGRLLFYLRTSNSGRNWGFCQELLFHFK